MSKSVAEIQALSDAEFRAYMTACGLVPGMIRSKAARKVLESKLFQHLNISPSSSTDQPALVSDLVESLATAGLEEKQRLSVQHEVKAKQDDSSTKNGKRPTTEGSDSTHDGWCVICAEGKEAIVGHKSDWEREKKNRTFIPCASEQQACEKRDEIILRERVKAMSLSAGPGESVGIVKPKRQDVNASNDERVAFRQAIEKGDFEKCKRMVYQNPRLLVQKDGRLTVLVENRKQSPLHVCCDRMNPRPEILAWLLEQLQPESDYWKLYAAQTAQLQSLDSANGIKLENASQELEPTHASNPLVNPLDVDLNTPLHFAARDGLVECVALLMTCPGIDLHCKNVPVFNGDQPATPRECICQRLGAGPATEKKRREIEKLFDERFFVPLLEDNTTDLVVGDPVDFSLEPLINIGADAIVGDDDSEAESKKDANPQPSSPFSSPDRRNAPSRFGTPVTEHHSPLTRLQQGVKVRSASNTPTDGASKPLKPIWKVRAMAGPMSESKAGEFCNRWRAGRGTPQRSLIQNLKLSDMRRGYERAGSVTAHDMHVPWHENWPWLDSPRSPASVVSLNSSLASDTTATTMSPARIKLQGENGGVKKFDSTNGVDLRSRTGLQSLEKHLDESGNLFILGTSPSRVDHDAFTAIFEEDGEASHGDQLQQLLKDCPCVEKWAARVKETPAQERKKWPENPVQTKLVFD